MRVIRAAQVAVRHFAALLILATCGKPYLDWLRQGFGGPQRQPAPVKAELPSQEDKTGSIDVPLPGQLVDADVFEVRGWAFIDGQSPESVEVEIDGNVVVSGRVGIPRPDIGGFDETANAPVCGFQAHVPIGDREIGELVVGVKAVFPGGSIWRAKTRTINRIRTQRLPKDRSPELRSKTIEEIRAIPAGTARPGFILFTHSLGVGGGQLFILEMLRRMAQEAPLQCTVVSPINGPLSSEFERLGADVHISEGIAPSDPAAYEGKLREIATFVKTSGYRVALLNTLGVYPAAEACNIAGVPTVWSIHESFDVAEWASLNYGPGYTFRADRIKSALTNANALVFEADATSEMYSKYADSEKRITVPYGVDLGEISEFIEGFDRGAARRRLDLPEDSRIVLCMGVLEARKAQISLAQAFAQVADKYPDATLVIVGDHPGNYSDALHAFIKRSDLDSRIRLVKISSNIYQWYAVADLLISASDTESLPRSFLEAMAFSLPILSTDVYGVPELITDSKNGWLFPARDTAALTAALDRVLSMDREIWSQVAGVAKEQVSRSHDSCGYAREYAALLAGFAADPSAKSEEILGQARATYNVVGVTVTDAQVDRASAAR